MHNTTQPGTAEEADSSRACDPKTLEDLLALSREVASRYSKLAVFGGQGLGMNLLAQTSIELDHIIKELQRERTYRSPI